MSEERTSTLKIPPKIRSLVYLVGTLGFPIVIAVYLLVVLSADMNNLEQKLVRLELRIDERPMNLEKSKDFIIYITDSLRADLQDDLPEFVKSIKFNVDNSTTMSLDKAVSLIQRKVDAYIRPIVRKHQRFASRFPSVGGSLGSSFILSVPSEELAAGEAEAHLRGETTKEVSESLATLIINNIADFGDREKMARIVDEQNSNQVDPFILISPDLFLELTNDAIETTTTLLRDQMLERVQLDSS